jgi:hypothetical protein
MRRFCVLMAAAGMAIVLSGESAMARGRIPPARPAPAYHRSPVVHPDAIRSVSKDDDSGWSLVVLGIVALSLVVKVLSGFVGLLRWAGGNADDVLASDLTPSVEPLPVEATQYPHEAARDREALAIRTAGQ